MAGTRTTRITRGYGTESNERGENLETQQDASDILGLETEIGGRRGSVPRRSPLGGIDLNKGLDLEKPRAPRSGIGIDIGKSEAGNLGIGVEIPLPVPAPISARGKVAIDPATGKIRGGGLGIGLGKGPIGASIDVGVDTPKGSEEFGCFKYVTVTVSFFSHTFGKNECEPKPPVPTPSPSPGSLSNDGSFKPGNLPKFDTKCTYSLSILCFGPGIEFIDCVGYGSNESSHGWMFTSEQPAPGIYGEFGARTKHPSRDYYVYTINAVPPPVGFVEIRRLGLSRAVVKGDLIYGAGPWYRDDAPNIGSNVTTPGTAYYSDYWTSYHGLSASQAANVGSNFMNWWPMQGWDSYAIKVDQKCPGDVNYKPLNNSPSTPSSLSPIPNPPPRKKMDKDCCEKLEILLIETLRTLGRQVTSKGKILPVGNVKGFLGEDIERTKTPIKDARKPEKEKIRFGTLYQMLSYALQQSNDLDTALDPKSYKIPTGYLQNPEYSRDSKASLIDNKQPDKDASGNDRQLEIHEDEGAKFSGFIQQQSYIFEAIKRLEYLFPFGELSDAKIAKDLLIPGQEGDIKIHNMIMAYEIMMQYINATLGNPREVLTIKDANPAIDGDQPIEVKALTISDWMRQVVKFQIDTGGDLDVAINLMLRDFRTNLANRTDIIKTAEMTQALFEDSGMREQQEYIQVHLEGDPYAGQWVKGEGFKPNSELEKKTEEATEKVLQETMNPTNIKLKVSRRHKDEKTDMRDLFRGLADFVQRLLSVASGGDVAKSIDKLIESAKFKVQTEAALLRQNIVKAATASRNRTKKRKK